MKLVRSGSGTEWPEDTAWELDDGEADDRGRIAVHRVVTAPPRPLPSVGMTTNLKHHGGAMPRPV